jgi:hypothetical protein
MILWIGQRAGDRGASFGRMRTRSGFDPDAEPAPERSALPDRHRPLMVLALAAESVAVSVSPALSELALVSLLE